MIDKVLEPLGCRPEATSEAAAAQVLLFGLAIGVVLIADEPIAIQILVSHEAPTFVDQLTHEDTASIVIE